MTEYALPADASLMILDDDAPFRTRLSRALEQRGFQVDPVETVAEARSKIRISPPLSLIHISEPTRLRRISYAVFCLKKKKK